MNYIIYNRKIRAIVNVIKYSYSFKNDDKLKRETISGERYVLNGEDYNKVLKQLEYELMQPENENVEITVEDADCAGVIDYDGIEASDYNEAERIIKNLTLEEQLVEAQFEIDRLKLEIE